MTRLINADAIEYVNHLVSVGNGQYEHADITYRHWIDNIPTVEAEPHWIPCSERLPENCAEVLVWFEYFRYGEYNRLHQTYGIGEYFENYDSWLIDHETGWQKLRVIAWMPLPESYSERR